MIDFFPDIQWIKIFFFQAEDGIRDRSPSRGLGDVYKRQGCYPGSIAEGKKSKILYESLRMVYRQRQNV